MEATEVLKTEHRAIKLMLDILESINQRLERGETVPSADLAAIVEFIRVFADRCHHGKEEDLLFPAMERAGIPSEGGPIGVMLAEHEIGRTYVRGLAEAAAELAAGNADACTAVVRNARGYITLLRDHIDKEDNILYMMAEMHVSPDTDKRLVEEFERVEEEKIGHGKHEEFHELLHRLRDTYLTPTR